MALHHYKLRLMYEMMNVIYNLVLKYSLVGIQGKLHYN